jgi:organic hydroperoxide reductase OsmC/OhrA
VTATPSGETLHLSADQAFLGDAARVNPEQLLLISASSCQLLSFLAIVARARISVVSYADEAEAVMPEDELPVRITKITMRPRIVVDGPADEARVRRYVELAHRECYVANTLTAEFAFEPEIEIR